MDTGNAEKNDPAIASVFMLVPFPDYSIHAASLTNISITEKKVGPKAKLVNDGNMCMLPCCSAHRKEESVICVILRVMHVIMLYLAACLTS